MNGSPNNPRGPSMLSRNGNRLSQRGMLSLLMLLASIGALSFALIGGAKLVLDICFPIQANRQIVRNAVFLAVVNELDVVVERSRRWHPLL